MNLMKNRYGSVTLMHGIIGFIIVLAATLVMGSLQGGKIIDNMEGMEFPLVGGFCPGDRGVVPEKVFLNNLENAVKVAWKSKKTCRITQTLEDGGTISYKNLYNNITDAMDVFLQTETNDCIGGYFSETTPDSVSKIDIVFWWDDTANCDDDGVIIGTYHWLIESVGDKTNTLYFQTPMGYCKGEPPLDDGFASTWYTQPARSNMAKYSQSKGLLNEDEICNEDNLKLPEIEDRTNANINLVESVLLIDMESCKTGYETEFNGGYINDIYVYLACKKKFLVNFSADTKISDLYDGITNYNGVAFSYTADACDIMDNLGDPEPSEFNSASWWRASPSDNCIYILLNRAVQTEEDILNPADDSHILKADTEYLITQFHYFERGDDDIVVTIDKVY